jgi:hypothetical protein
MKCFLYFAMSTGKIIVALPKSKAFVPNKVEAEVTFSMSMDQDFRGAA